MTMVHACVRLPIALFEKALGAFFKCADTRLEDDHAYQDNTGLHRVQAEKLRHNEEQEKRS